MRHEELAEAISLSPALQQLDAVFRHHWLPVVPLLRPSRNVNVYFIPSARPVDLINHLRLHLKMLVRAEKSVVDEIAMVACDVSGRPNRI